jgi:cytochrome c oxidase subunit II
MLYSSEHPMPQQFGPPTLDPISPQGASILELFVQALLPSALIFLLIVGLLAYVVVRYRARPGDGEPAQIEGHRGLEIAWTLGPAVLLAGLFLLTARTMRIVEAETPDALRVVAVGNQWWWEYRYPDLGVVTANELHVPVDQSLQLEITTTDVIHSFWVPQFGWKKDAIPGKTNRMFVRIDRPGVFEGACAEFCGLQHAWMRTRVVTETRSDFDAWVGQQRAPPAVPSTLVTQRGLQVFETNTCVTCHTIQGTAGNGRVGPDLSHIGGRATIAGGVLENTPDNISLWIRDPQTVKSGALMPTFTNLPADDLASLTAYLGGLK